MNRNLRGDARHPRASGSKIFLFSLPPSVFPVNNGRKLSQKRLRNWCTIRNKGTLENPPPEGGGGGDRRRIQQFLISRPIFQRLCGKYRRWLQPLPSRHEDKGNFLFCRVSRGVCTIIYNSKRMISINLLYYMENFLIQIFLENNSILMKKFNNKLNFASLLQYNLHRLFLWQNLIQFSRIYFPNFNIYILVLQTQLFPSIFITRYPVYLLRAEYPVSPLINSVVKKRHASSELLAKKGVFLRRCVFNARWIEQEEGNRSNRG